MAHFGIQTSQLTDQIHIGLLDPTGHRFLDRDDILDTEGRLRQGMEELLFDLAHEDHTDRTLRVVADHVLDHYAGAIAVDYKDGAAYEITITRTNTPDAVPAGSDPAGAPRPVDGETAVGDTRSTPRHMSRGDG